MSSRSIPGSSSASADREPRSLGDVLEWLRKSFRSDRARDVSVAYQFELTGADGGALWARIGDGRLDTGRGALIEPDVVFRLEATLLFGVLGGSVNPDLLLMERRLEVEGDLSLALKLRSLFSATG